MAKNLLLVFVKLIPGNQNYINGNDIVNVYGEAVFRFIVVIRLWLG